MTREILAILAMALILGVFVAVMVLSYRTEKRRQADYAALAERRGLRFEFRRHQGRSPAELRFAAPDGVSLVVTRKLSRKSGSSTTTTGGHSLFRANDPRLPGGMAVYAPQMPAGVASAAASLMGMFDNSLAKMILGKLLGDEIGAYLGQMDEVAPPQGVALTILATANPNAQFDAGAIAHAIEAAPRSRNSEARTMVLLGESGMQLRVGQALNEATEIEQLLDAGLALRTALLSQRASS